MKQDPTFFEPRSMFCNFDFGDILSAGISLFAGSQAAGAAEDASQAMVRAAEIAAGESRNALAFTREAYDVGRADLAPYRATGAGALQTMNQMFIPGGHPMVRLQGQLNELRAQRARLQSGSGGAGGGAGNTGSQDQTAALRQIWDRARASSDSSGAQDRAEAGFDPNFGAGEWEGDFLGWAEMVGGMLAGIASGPVGTVAAVGGQLYDAVTGEPTGGGEPSVSVDWSGADTSGGRDYQGTSVAEGGSGARDDIGTRDGGGGSANDGAGTGGGDMGRGLDPGGGAAGSPFHKGGPVTDNNPKTYRNNMRITAQEGEVVMSRPAVKMLGKNFLIRANKAAVKRKRSK